MTSFMSLADLGLETSPAALLTDWLQQMQTAYPSYQPSAANLEYIVAQIVAGWAADLAQYTSQGASDLFETYGTKLIGLPYQQGVEATAIVEVTAASTTGFTLPAGTQVTLDSLGFVTETPVVIPSGSVTALVTVLAIQPGALFNGAGSGGSVQLVSQIDWVSSVTLAAAASGGIDAEDADHYLNRLTTTLQLMAPRPITAGDYANFSLNFTPALGTDQEEVGRATSIDGYNPSATTFTATTTSASATLTVVSSFAGISAASGGQPGSIITGTNIPPNTTVVSVNTGASTLLMSHPASANGTAATLTSTGSYGNERTVTVYVTDANGNALNSDTLTAVETWLTSLREINFVVNVLSPTYIPIYVACSVHPLSGWSNSTVQANVQASLISFLSPTNYGLPVSSAIGWTNYPTIYASKLMLAIMNSGGVDYADSLVFGTSASPSNTADLTLYAAAPLPTSSTTTIPTSGITII